MVRQGKKKKKHVNKYEEEKKYCFGMVMGIELSF